MVSICPGVFLKPLSINQDQDIDKYLIWCLAIEKLETDHKGKQSSLVLVLLCLLLQLLHVDVALGVHTHGHNAHASHDC